MDAFLAAGLRVVRYDNRGIGATSKPSGPYTTAQFAADLRALVEHLQLGRFHLAGISMGGMIAQEYALAHGDSLALSCSRVPTRHQARSAGGCTRCGRRWRR
jgi:3-oxoadipate enol-lactonase